jgi:cyclic 2,3-diphosphoglycerate synthetase
VVVDGEHYPPVIEAALEGLRSRGHEIAGAIMIGGREKLPDSGELELAGVEVTAGSEPPRLLAEALDSASPEAVLDLSDEPVLDYRRRHRLAAVALARGVPYQGHDFRFTPPRRVPLATRPTVAVIGTGKRTGKTAVMAYAARTLVEAGRRPVVVAMGRGGPPEPEVIRGDELDLTPADLLALADEGKHAASDYVEDALLGRVPTVGCRRCGGGLAGGVEISNVERGVDLANGIEADICMLEGSGSAVPPVSAHATVLIAPASIPEEYIAGYFGPYRLLLSDLVVVTMAEEPFASSARISSLSSSIRDTWTSVAGWQGQRHEIEVVRTVFRPSPTRSVDGAKVCVATTAPEAAGESIRSHLEAAHGCRVLGVSHSLSDRAQLRADLDEITKGADILLCEIKAAGIDVATRSALDRGLEVVYMDNVPVGLESDDTAAALRHVADLAVERWEESK